MKALRVVVFIGLIQGCAQQEVPSSIPGKVERNVEVFSVPPESEVSVTQEESRWVAVTSVEDSTSEDADNIELSDKIGVNYQTGQSAILRFRRTCSTRGSNFRTNMMRSSKMKVSVEDVDTGQLICQFNNKSHIKRQLLKNGSLDLSKCNLPLEDRKYRVRFYNEKGQSLLADKKKFAEGKFDRSVIVQFHAKDNELVSKGKIFLLYDSNAKRNKIFKTSPGREHLIIPHKAPQHTCDTRNSPLVVDLRQDRQELFTLTRPEAGVLFNLLGEEAQPVPNTPVQISWLTHSRVAFLTLPDETGFVNGINELFGDNTVGPDGQLALDGYHALAKYDGLNLSYHSAVYGERDGVIDSEDGVFPYLRLWFDRDLDGVAQKNELVSLNEAGIKSIGLKVDKSFYMKDQFENELIFKADVEMTDGSTRTMYDIWFNTEVNP